MHIIYKCLCGCVCVHLPTTVVSHLSPSSVLLSAGVVALALGDVHTCGLVTGGGVYCWGGNAYGQLGTGDTNDRLTPTAVTGLGTGESI